MNNITDTYRKPPPSREPKGSPPRRSFVARALLGVLFGVIGIGVSAVLMVGYVLVIAMPQLPSLEAVTDYQPKVPMRIFTADHVLIGEFGEERRTIVHAHAFPDMLKNAVLAIEDDRFYQHSGIDYIGIVRAGMANVVKGGNAQGASTITMQVARNFFLSSEKTYTRKIYEVLLAYKIERALSKEQILELYMNQIYLGQRAYGFGSAANVYFDKAVKDLTLAEAAMLAGLPKAPSAYNPVSNFKRAQIRQHHILKRMLDLGYIEQAQYDQAIQEAIRIRTPGHQFTVHAEYVAETVRQLMLAQYPDDAYTRGLNVVTTIQAGDQQVAYEAVRKGVLNYEKRHAYRGPEATIVLPSDPDEQREAIEDVLLKYPDNGEIVSVVVLTASAKSLTAMQRNGNLVTLSGTGLRFAAAMLPPEASGTSPPGATANVKPNASRKPTSKTLIRPGAIIRVALETPSTAARPTIPSWQIVQTPQVEGAFVAVTPEDGAIRAMVGGFDFNKNKFNHVTQAWRQPGSVFKPFIYSAALETGIGPATLIDDAPLYFTAAQTGAKAWAPKNYGGNFAGPTTMRTALMKSKNLVTIRIMQAIGPGYAQDYVTRFGFDAEKHPPYLPMALGAGQVTPLQVAAAYAVFANGGFRVNPYLIKEVSDTGGNVLSHATPLVAGVNATRVLDARNDYIMYSMLHDVARHGSAAGTNVLKRNDLAGKTGTTNDSRDAWFAGYHASLAAVSWIGYDQPRSLGNRATGSSVAMPVWIDYMAHALKTVAPVEKVKPDGIEIINGEVYMNDRMPGAGFVPTVDLPVPQDQIATIDEYERQQVLDLFSGKDAIF